MANLNSKNLDARSPLGAIFFIFMQFLAKFANNRLAPTWVLLGNLQIMFKNAAKYFEIKLMIIRYSLGLFHQNSGGFRREENLVILRQL